MRGGCPADWVWIVPPISGSLTPVFHQEMINYSLKPSYEYQEVAWKKYNWQFLTETSDGDVSLRAGLCPFNHGRGLENKKRFKQLAIAVRFASCLFRTAVDRRIKVTVLYASETGKSEKFAKQLAHLFNHNFNAHVNYLFNLHKLERDFSIKF